MDIGEVLRCRYRIIDLLKESSSISTYLAEDTDTPYKNYCVVREIKVGFDMISTCKREFNKIAQNLYQLGFNYDRFPSVLATFEEKDCLYLVEEFINGDNLGIIITPGQKWTEFETIQLIEEILRELLI